MSSRDDLSAAVKASPAAKNWLALLRHDYFAAAAALDAAKLQGLLRSNSMAQSAVAKDQRDNVRE